MNSDLENWKKVECRLSAWLDSTKHWAVDNPAYNNFWYTTVRFCLKELKKINEDVQLYGNISPLKEAYKWYFADDRLHVTILRGRDLSQNWTPKNNNALSNSDTFCFPQIWIEASIFLRQCAYLLSKTQEQMCTPV